VAGLVLGLSFVFAFSVKAKEEILYFFGTGCPHCAQVEEFIEKNEIEEKYDITKIDIYQDREGARQFDELMTAAGVPLAGRGVPAAVIGEKIIVGDKPIIEQFEQEAERYLEGGEDEKEQSGKKREEGGLTWLAVLMGSLVDAVNPCEFAVLILLVSTVLATGDSKRALKSGLSFAAAIFVSYFAMGLGLYQALSWGAVAGKIVIWFGYLAILLGLLNLKDYFWYGKGVLMEVPLSWRPKMKKLLTSVTSPWGAFGVGMVVSLFLLPCTSGPYIVILGMLARNALDWQAIGYLAIYNLVFVSPMVLITLAIYRGFDPKKAEEIRQKRLRQMHLAAGIVLLVMGVMIATGWI